MSAGRPHPGDVRRRRRQSLPNETIGIPRCDAGDRRTGPGHFVVDPRLMFSLPSTGPPHTRHGVRWRLALMRARLPADEGVDKFPQAHGTVLTHSFRRLPEGVLVAQIPPLQLQNEYIEDVGKVCRREEGYPRPEIVRPVRTLNCHAPVVARRWKNFSLSSDDSARPPRLAQERAIFDGHHSESAMPRENHRSVPCRNDQGVGIVTMTR